MSTEDAPHQRVTPDPAPRLGSHYGSQAGRTAYARETAPGSWQVKVFDPTNRLAAHDGWLLLGVDWPSLGAAQAATGLA